MSSARNFKSGSINFVGMKKTPQLGNIRKASQGGAEGDKRLCLFLFYPVEVTLTKKIFSLIVLLSALVYGLVTLTPDHEVKNTRPMAIPSVTATATPVVSCEVVTGFEEGHVNLRTCAGMACPVLLVLEDGQALTLIQPGAWNEVETLEGVRGWLNSKYCK